MLCGLLSVGVLYIWGAGTVFAWLSLWRKFGELHACGATFSYIVGNALVFNNEIGKEGLPGGNTSAGCRSPASIWLFTTDLVWRLSSNALPNASFGLVRRSPPATPMQTGSAQKARS